MKPIEERLWEYIDGTCSPDEKSAIEQLLIADPAIRQLYEEFLSLSHHLRSMELEEPALRFTQNVMDRVVLEPAPKALRTKIDKRIINGIGGFFIVTLALLLGYSLSQVSWGSGDWNFSFTLPQINLSPYFGSAFMQASMIAFVVIGLFAIDKYIHHRKRMQAVTHSS